MATVVCVLIDRMGFNGYVLGSATGDTSEEAIAALKQRTLDKQVRSASNGWITLDEDLWDRIQATYDGDLDGEETGIELEVFELGDVSDFVDP